MLLPIRKNSIRNTGVIGQMSAGISILTSNMELHEKKSLLFLTKLEMTPLFLMFVTVLVVMGD